MEPDIVRLLQRYIFFELLRLFLFLVTVLTLLLVFVGVFREASERGLGPVQIFQVLPYVVPSMLPFTIPATLLLTVCVVYGRIAGDQEVIAAKAAGINVLSLVNPALLLGALLTVASFGLTNRVIPWAAGNIESVVAQAVERIFLDVLSAQHSVNSPDKGYSITVDRVEGKRLIRPTFKYAVNGRQHIVLAEEASLDFDLENEKILVRLKKAALTRPGQKKGSWLESCVIPIPMPSAGNKLQARNMPIDAIKREIARVIVERDQLEIDRDLHAITALTFGNFRQLSRDEMVPLQKNVDRQLRIERKLRTEMHSRFALSGSCLLFVLLGAPFSILRAKQQFLTNFIMCFLPILLVYYPVMFLMANLSKSGSIAPWWSMWVANLVIAVGGAICLKRVIQY